LMVTTVTTGAGVADGAGVIADFSASSDDFLEHPNKPSVMINPPMAIKAKGLGLEVWIVV
ncbi:MAG: hypothetical protein WCO34_10590, partial [Betaproteobacteria bacterium]